MKILMPIATAVIVAAISLIGQFFISNRRFIPEIREERARAYSGFLAACLTGMAGVLIEKGILEDLEKPDGIYRKADEGKMRELITESLKNYNSEINRTLSTMQIVAPEAFAALGRILMTEISDYREGSSTQADMESAYSKFTERAHRDIQSLTRQSTSLKAVFSRNIKELRD